MAEDFDRFRGRGTPLVVFERFLARRFMRVAGIRYVLFGRPGFDWFSLADRFSYFYHTVSVLGYRVPVSPLFRLAEEAA